MELDLDYESIFGKRDTYEIPGAAKDGLNRMTTNDDKTAVLCYRHPLDAQDDDDDEEETPFGSCLICLAHIKDDIQEHVKKCLLKLLDEKNCSICLNALDSKHIYSHSHAVQVEKFKLILEKNNGFVGLAKGGELGLDLKGTNIVRKEGVYDILNRLKNGQIPKPGGLAAYHLNAAVQSAETNASLSKNMAENSTIVQMLMQVAMAASNSFVPCVSAAKLSYSVSGYSMIELIGALNQQYPEDYDFKLVEINCALHKKKEKTIKFVDCQKSFNHLTELLNKITGKNIVGVETEAEMKDQKKVETPKVEIPKTSNEKVENPKHASAQNADKPPPKRIHTIQPPQQSQ